MDLFINMAHTIDFNLLKTKINNFENNKNNNENENEKTEEEMIVKKNGELYLVKYNKKFINNENINTLGKYRSIIFDKDRLVSFSPPKSLRFNNNFEMENLQITEFYEGTMINLFFYNNKWEIATKSVIGANCKYYLHQNKTYREMFFEVINHLNINLDDFNKNFSYSFVLQHPENRIVSKIKNMNLILIKCYSFKNNIIKEELIDEKFNFLKPIDLTKIFYKHSVEEIFNNYLCFTSEKKDFNKVGIVLTNKNFERIKIRNFYYEHVKRLKGNSPKMQFMYYTIKKTNRIKEFLTFFPESAGDFLKFKNELYTFTENLYQKYISCFIKKESKLINMEYEYKPHIYALHKMYLENKNKIVNIRINDNIIEKKFKIDKKRVIDYVNNLEPERLMFCINYNKRLN